MNNPTDGMDSIDTANCYFPMVDRQMQVFDTEAVQVHEERNESMLEMSGVL